MSIGEYKQCCSQKNVSDKKKKKIEWFLERKAVYEKSSFTKNTVGKWCELIPYVQWNDLHSKTQEGWLRFVTLPWGMAEVLEAYHPLPLDGKSPPQTAEHLRAQTCPGVKWLLALKSPEQSEPASSAACRKIYFVVIEKAVSRRKGEEKRNWSEQNKALWVSEGEDNQEHNVLLSITPGQPQQIPPHP